MKARQNSDDDNRAYVRDAKMVPPENKKDMWYYYRVIVELGLVLLFLVSTLLIVLTIMQG